MKFHGQTDSDRSCLRSGARKAAIIDQTQIVLSAEFRAICERNRCGGYGRCWMRPPFLGDLDELRNEVRTYDCGLLYQTVGALEGSYDIDGMFEISAVHARVSQTLQKSLGAMEGYGIVAYQTSKDTALMYSNGRNTVTYFGIVLIKE